MNAHEVRRIATIIGTIHRLSRDDFALLLPKREPIYLSFSDIEKLQLKPTVTEVWMKRDGR